MDSDLGLQFAHKVRIRICGILIENERILLVKHEGLGKLGTFWSPPGGGVEFGETVEETLQREFLEETGLEVKCGPFILFHEHIDSRFHALELFFKVDRIKGVEILGSDPEMEGKKAMLVDLKRFGKAELLSMPSEAYHKRIPDFLGF